PSAARAARAAASSRNASSARSPVLKSSAQSSTHSIASAFISKDRKAGSASANFVRADSRSPPAASTRPSHHNAIAPFRLSSASSQISSQRLNRSRAARGPPESSAI